MMANLPVAGLLILALNLPAPAAVNPSPQPTLTRSLNHLLFVAAFQVFPEVIQAESRPVPTRPTPPMSPQQPPRLIAQGTQMTLNGRSIRADWAQWQAERQTEPRFGISDLALMQHLGLELLNTREYSRQPIQWFAAPIVLTPYLTPQTRYLDLTELARSQGWQLQVQNDVLQLTLPPTRLIGIRQGTRLSGQRFVIDLERSTAWQLTRQGAEAVISLDATVDDETWQRFQPSLTNTIRDALQHSPSPILERQPDRLLVRLPAPPEQQVRVTTLANPTRLVIDLSPDATMTKDIAWAPGIRWREQVIRVGEAQFPIIGLAINPRQFGLVLQPIWPDATTASGIAPLLSTAQRWQAIAAINGGFFNRNTQLPLGAVRQEQRWLSGPILGRGAVAWNQRGDIRMARFTLQETLVINQGKRLPLLTLNSGYAQAGIARYTPDWGPTYTPITDNETLVAVTNNQIMGYAEAGAAGQTAFPIPPNGYLLILRANRSVLPNLPVGATVQVESLPDPIDFAQFPQIIGGGPLLLQNRQIVLDAKLEKFSDAFIREQAVRSTIARMPDGTLMLTTIQERVGGSGPTLAETAQVMQQLGAIDALNLDGGSSTTLYLGGQVINRPAFLTARVHNGIGVFLRLKAQSP